MPSILSSYFCPQPYFYLSLLCLSVHCLKASSINHLLQSSILYKTLFGDTIQATATVFSTSKLNIPGTRVPPLRKVTCLCPILWTLFSRAWWYYFLLFPFFLGHEWLIWITISFFNRWSIDSRRLHSLNMGKRSVSLDIFKTSIVCWMKFFHWKCPRSGYPKFQ